jgi:uncharacterized RDD family membrane protein YckC
MRAALPAAAGATPGLARRMACFVYEGVLLLGVVMIAGWLFSTLTQQRHALVGRHAMQAFLFGVLGVYFTWFWSKSGQTVAMKTWHLRVVDGTGLPPSQPRALLRYLLAWLWFLPALATLGAFGLRGGGEIAGVTAAGVVGYALLALLHPQHQFLHDALCGTRLVSWRPEAGAPRRARHNPAP